MNARKLVSLAFLGAALAAVGCGGDDGADVSTGSSGAGGAAKDGGATGGRAGTATGSSGSTLTSGGSSGAVGSGGATTDAGGDVSTGGSAGLGGGGTGAGGSTLADASSEPSIPEGGVTCGVFGDPCTYGATCCSQVCDSNTHTCASRVEKCSAAGTSCSAPTDCCSLNCGSNGYCAPTACVSDGQTCTGTTGGCCGGTCSTGACQALNPICRTSGNTCTTNDQCCSHLCGADGHCLLGGSYCIQTGDVCVRGSDCCGGICNIASGNTLGTCSVPAPGGTRCSGAVDGTFCNGCGTCCSRLCAPYGPTGVFICQPANGCHIDGDLCLRDRDCCGNDSSLPTSGQTVQCVREHATDTVGVCRNPMGCSPEGNVCHYRGDETYTCNVSSAPNNCCGATGNSGACVLDQLGVPRCKGIGTCRKGGETCAFTGDCCNNVPCVPDDSGQLRCLAVPDGGTSCVPSAGNCTVTADCCPGTSCIVPQGSTLGKCGIITTPPPDGGTSSPDGSTAPDGGTTPPDDGGTSTPDATPPPVCSQYGQICTTNADCCNGIPCYGDGGICRIPPM